MEPLKPIALSEIQAARERISKFVTRTPLVRYTGESSAEIFLKLENLQPIGSFKVRGSANALEMAGKKALAKGVYTASAGNMAQGLAWNARRLQVPCTAIVPEHAPATKLDAIRRFGAEIVKVPFDVWWNVLITHTYERMEGLFVHPVSHPAVIAGNGTIGLEILEDLPDVTTVLVPFGGGGLSSGIASAVKALKPWLKVFACEVETAAPFAASLAAGTPQEVDYRPSFVDGIGGKSVLSEMWPLTSKLLEDSLVMSLAEIAAAVRNLAERNHIVAEGAGAISLAAATAGKAGSGGKIVCIVSGGNIDPHKLAKILVGEVP